MSYLWFKALHVVGFVSWFAGLFYIVRLFIYHVESAERPEPERTILHQQFVIMERRLWFVIAVPAMVITFLFGAGLAYYNINAAGALAPWLAVKLGFVLVLFAYHLTCGAIRRQLAEQRCRWTSSQLRLWNEAATLLLVAIVMLAVFKTLFDALWGALLLVAFGLVLAVAVKLVRGGKARKVASP
jgi:protoporphyrinogen IX oxidase